MWGRCLLESIHATLSEDSIQAGQPSLENQCSEGRVVVVVAEGGDSFIQAG